MRRRVRLSRWLWAGTAIALVAVLVAAQNSTVLFPQLVSYRLVDERTIAVTVGVAPCAWTRVTGVAETSTAIAVKVETLPCPLPLPGTAQLDLRELTVTIADDVGSRTITDAQGQPIPVQTAGP